MNEDIFISTLLLHAKIKVEEPHKRIVITISKFPRLWLIE